MDIHVFSVVSVFFTEENVRFCSSVVLAVQKISLSKSKAHKTLASGCNGLHR